jgi:hypothetical protein
MIAHSSDMTLVKVDIDPLVTAVMDFNFFKGIMNLKLKELQTV